MADPSARARRPDQLVSQAIDRAYLAFAGHRIGPSMRVVGVDVEPEHVRALAVPVRTVTAAAIDRWLPHAVTTWGRGSDLRALVPRMLELFASGALTTPPEVMLRKVRLSGLASWSVEEQASVDDVVAAVWLATLTRWPRPDRHPAWRLLVAAAELGGSLAPLLDDWSLVLATRGPDQGSARAHLQVLDAKVAQLAARGEGVGALFWAAHPSEEARLAGWLDASATRAQLGGSAPSS